MTGAPRPSTFRLAAGVIVLLAALISLPYGFMGLRSALEGSGYGSPEVRSALIVLGIAGAALGGGVSLLIWEMAARLRRW